LKSDRPGGQPSARVARHYCALLYFFEGTCVIGLFGFVVLFSWGNGAHRPFLGLPGSLWLHYLMTSKKKGQRGHSPRPSNAYGLVAQIADVLGCIHACHPKKSMLTFLFSFPNMSVHFRGWVHFLSPQHKNHSSRMKRRIRSLAYLLLCSLI
jgi:hypothetical protein